MQKIPRLFLRVPPQSKNIVDVPNPLAQWVFFGQGWATRKYDGTCCSFKNGKFYRRRTIKKNKPVPKDFIAIEYDKNTGKTVGWVPVGKEADCKYHRQALQNYRTNSGGAYPPSGTYELLGPKIQGNPEGYDQHILKAHSEAAKFVAPRNFNGLKMWLKNWDIEGLVWHHSDGRMAKIRKADFNLPRKPEEV